MTISETRRINSVLFVSLWQLFIWKEEIVTNQRKAGVILSYTSEAVKMITGLIYTPIMLRLLGQSEYGLYQLVFSVVSYLGLLSMGFGSSYMRFYSRRKAQNDEKGIAKLNGMFMCIFITISVICVICGIVMLGNIRAIFGTGLTVDEYDTAKVLMTLMVVSLAITFPNSVFDCNLMAQERFIFQKSLGLAQSILNPFLTLPLLLLGKGSVGMVCVSTLLTFSCFIVNVIYGVKVTKIKFLFRELDFSLLKEMWVFTFYIFISQIIDQVNWSVDKFLLGRMIGTGAVAVYGVGGQINSMYLQFSTSVSNVFIPSVNKIVAETNDNDKLTKIFTKVGRIQFIIMMLILSGFVFVGLAFVEFWAGKEYIEAYYVTLFLIVPVTIPLIQNLGIEIQRAKNMHKSRSFVYLVISVCNIFISIPLIRVFGATGAAMGTALALIAGNIVFINWYYHSRIKLNMFFFWKNIIKIFPALILPIACGVIIKYVIGVDSFLEIVLFAGLYSIIYAASMWFIGFNEYEKQLVRGMLHKIIKRG